MNSWSRRAVLMTGAAAGMTSGAFSGTYAAAQSPFLSTSGGATQGRERQLLDFGWRFHMGHATEPAKDFGFGLGRSGNFQKTGDFMLPSQPAYLDNGWTDVNLPHDWAISLPFVNDPDIASKAGYPLGRTHPDTSVGWYRRVFDLPVSDAGKRITVQFDGVCRDALVVLNGYYIGRHAGTYDPFSFDITDFVNVGGSNILLVRVDATLTDGWFYEGAGIYRHVWLAKTAPIHVRQWGAFVRCEVAGDTARVLVRTEVDNAGRRLADARVVSTILDPSGQTVARSVSDSAPVLRSGGNTYEQQVTVTRPILWSLEDPKLYRLITEIEVAGAIVDRQESRFGIRTVTFDPNQGFFLNGKPVKVKGTCNHQDHAGLGVALPDAAQYFRIRRLKEMGCNAYRTSHNPPTPELLDACDELGMLVMDETRLMSSNPEGEAQFTNLVRRDRNHPSVFFYSLGNEESEASTERGLAILSALKDVATQHDGSRPVTVSPQPFGLALGDGGLAVSDVMGYNYNDALAVAFHDAHPQTPVMGTENVSAVGARGIYATDPARGLVSAFDGYTTTGRGSAEGWWRFANSHPWMAGGFVWTGFDYRGEPSPFQWPNIGSQYGVMDACGFPKDTFYYYKAWWSSEPVLHVFPHWNWAGLEGKDISVWVYSNMDAVELFHNGRSLGRKDVPKDSHVQWTVAYQPGKVEARGFKNGRQVMVASRETAGAPAKIALRPDRTVISADGEDLAFFTVEVQDSRGRVVPITGNKISFKVTGPGKLLGVGNGDPTSHESDIGTTRTAFGGLCMAIVQSSQNAGDIHLEASSPGLQSAASTVNAKAVRLRPQVGLWRRPVPQGEGVTGLWRPASLAADDRGLDVLQVASSGGDMTFNFVQKDNQLTGAVEGPPGGFGGGPSGPIRDGRIEGDAVTFRAGNVSYNGVIKADHIELTSTASNPLRRSATPPAPPGPPPVIGPPPPGVDLSLGIGNRVQTATPPLILRRAAR